MEAEVPAASAPPAFVTLAPLTASVVPAATVAFELFTLPLAQ